MTKFVSSDQHFYHDKIISDQFRNRRPFATIKEHNDFIVVKHNSVVTPDDTSILLGDVIMNTQDNTLMPWLQETVGKLNGKLIIVPGNHCSATKIKAYMHFAKVVSYIEVGHDLLFSHIPVHVSQVENRFKANIHGHVHADTLPDTRYFNVSLEAIDYTPVSMAQIKATLRERGVF